ncbi:hypothetical protein V6N12_028119 [Hibiscus sabdariffa]|uniref:Uncharacterized protein n=1 Tax=Hibiscus sabdariffa TaxID=183260 RepID=A0ABR2F4Z0_9ROSI
MVKMVVATVIPTYIIGRFRWGTPIDISEDRWLQILPLARLDLNLRRGSWGSTLLTKTAGNGSMVDSEYLSVNKKLMLYTQFLLEEKLYHRPRGSRPNSGSPLLGRSGTSPTPVEAGS